MKNHRVLITPELRAKLDASLVQYDYCIDCPGQFFETFDNEDDYNKCLAGAIEGGYLGFGYRRRHGGDPDDPEFAWHRIDDLR